MRVRDGSPKPPISIHSNNPPGTPLDTGVLNIPQCMYVFADHKTLFQSRFIVHGSRDSSFCRGDAIYSGNANSGLTHSNSWMAGLFSGELELTGVSLHSTMLTINSFPQVRTVTICETPCDLGFRYTSAPLHATTGPLATWGYVTVSLLRVQDNPSQEVDES
jgi:hypothetical protein